MTDPILLTTLTLSAALTLATWLRNPPLPPVDIGPARGEPMEYANG